jgi:hypothetical protein
MNRGLAIAGTVAFRADRAAMALLRRPVGLLSFVVMLVFLAFGLWYLAPLAVGVVVVVDVDRQLDAPLWRLHGWRMGNYAPPALGDLPHGSLLAAAGLAGVMLVMSSPWAIVTLALRVALALVILAILVGWRFGYAIFRPQEDQTVGLAAELPARQFVKARASGELLTRACVLRVRVGNEDTFHTVLLRSSDPDEYEPRRFKLQEVRVFCAPSWGTPLPDGRPGPARTRLILITPSAKEGLSIARPDVEDVESRILTEPRSSQPALRLDTVLGPLVLAFDSAADRAVAFRAIREALA